MIATVYEMKREALCRMLLLGMHPSSIRKFECYDELSYSINGILYEMKEEWSVKIRKLEREQGFLVYHVLFNKTKSGNVLILFSVSDNENIWEDERYGIHKKKMCAYVLNLSNDLLYKENVAIKSEYGGIKRIQYS